jgi:hypothetical protein
MKRSKTPTFLLELPLRSDAGQAKRLAAHFEAARCLYNTLLGEALSRLHRMWADPAQAGRRRSPTCDSSTVSPNMPCMNSQNRPIVPGLPTTSMRLLRKR